MKCARIRHFLQASGQGLQLSHLQELQPCVPTQPGKEAWAAVRFEPDFAAQCGLHPEADPPDPGSHQGAGLPTVRAGLCGRALPSGVLLISPALAAAENCE